MKYIFVFLAALSVSACVDDSSDGDASTYDTCQITDSGASSADDLARDVSQCWSIRPTEDKQNALSQCRSRVASYRANEDIGYSVEYAVNSSSCP